MFAGAAPEAAKLVEHLELAAKVAKRLKLRWSPHAISADLRAEHMTISAETILSGVPWRPKPPRTARPSVPRTPTQQ
ncbi:MAG: hypothetical protein OXF75_08500 [Acidimicrobiaceae bacterium]|nr:hypothetical protein [Acidimicrobiaceae bacterium]